MKIATRDLLWLILVSAILFRWWVDHRQLTKKVHPNGWKTPSGGVTTIRKPPSPEKVRNIEEVRAELALEREARRSAE